MILKARPINRARFMAGAGYAAMTVAMLSLCGCGWFESSSSQKTMTASAQVPQARVADQTITLAEVLARQIKNIDDPSASARTTYIYANDPDYERKRRAWMVIDQGIKTAHQDSQTSATAAIGETRGQFILAAAAQQIEPSIRGAFARADQAFTTASPEKQQAINALRTEVSDLYNDMRGAQNDLAKSIGLSGPDDMVLAPQALSVATKPLPSMDVSVRDLEVLALHARKELEHTAGVSQDDVLSLREQTLKAFPGIGSILIRNAQGQIDLNDDEWTRFSESLTQSLTRLFTLPLSLQNPDTRAKMTSLREQALSAAIMAQVHVAYDDYTSSLRDLNGLKQADEISPASNNADDRVIADLNILYKTLRMNRAAADLNIAYARLLDTLGVAIVPDGADNMDPATLTASLENSLNLTSPDRIHGIIMAAAEGNVYRPSVILAQNIIPASYKPDDRGNIVQAGMANPFMKLRIPLPQKMSFRGKTDADLFNAGSYAGTTLNMDNNSVRKLLDSPITEP